MGVECRDQLLGQCQTHIWEEDMRGRALSLGTHGVLDGLGQGRVHRPRAGTWGPERGTRVSVTQATRPPYLRTDCGLQGPFTFLFSFHLCLRNNHGRSCPYFMNEETETQEYNNAGIFISHS